jgi:hypothetical protein
MTQDIDIVVDNRAMTDQLDRFVAAIDKSDFIFDATALRQATEQRSMFQLFDNVEALKLDIYPRELIAGELSRSRLVEVFAGAEFPVVSRPDAAAAPQPSRLREKNGRVRGGGHGPRDLYTLITTTALRESPVVKA